MHYVSSNGDKLMKTIIVAYGFMYKAEFNVAYSNGTASATISGTKENYMKLSSDIIDALEKEGYKKPVLTFLSILKEFEEEKK